MDDFDDALSDRTLFSASILQGVCRDSRRHIERQYKEYDRLLHGHTSEGRPPPADFISDLSDLNDSFDSSILGDDYINELIDRDGTLGGPSEGLAEGYIYGDLQLPHSRAGLPAEGAVERHQALDRAASQPRLAWDGRRGQWIPIAYLYTFPSTGFDHVVSHTARAASGSGSLAVRRMAKFAFAPSTRHKVMLHQGSPQLRLRTSAICKKRNPEAARRGPVGRPRRARPQVDASSPHNGQRRPSSKACLDDGHGEDRDVASSPLSTGAATATTSEDGLRRRSSKGRRSCYERVMHRNAGRGDAPTQDGMAAEDDDGGSMATSSYVPINPFHLEALHAAQPITWLDDIDVEEFLSSAIDYQTDNHYEGPPIADPYRAFVSGHFSKKLGTTSPNVPSSPPPPLFRDDDHYPIPEFRITPPLK